MVSYFLVKKLFRYKFEIEIKTGDRVDVFERFVLKI
jgi:hypothetical protein